MVAAVSAPTLQTLIDQAQAGSTLVLKKGVYNVEGTLKIDKDLNIVAEEGSVPEVIDFKSRSSNRAVRHLNGVMM